MLPSIPASPAPDDRTRIVSSVDRIDDRTALVPVARRPSRLRTLLPWAGFGVVAVVVVAATSAWASTLRSGDEPLLMNAAPPAAAAIGPPPAAAATVEVTASPGTTRSRAPRRAVAPTAVAPALAPIDTAVRPTSTVATTTKAAATTTRRPGLIGPGAGSCAPPDACPTNRTGTAPLP